MKIFSGKTIEIISLILGNPCTEKQIKAIAASDEDKIEDKVVAKTTLIVVPTTLLGQWFDEFDTRVDKPPSATPTVTNVLDPTCIDTTSTSSTAAAAADTAPMIKSSSFKVIPDAPKNATNTTDVIDLISDSSGSGKNAADDGDGKLSPTDDGSEEDLIEVVTPAATFGRSLTNTVVHEFADPPESFISVVRLDQLQVKSFFSCPLHLIRYPATETTPPSRWGYEHDNITPLRPKRGEILEYRVLAPYAIGRVMLHVEFRQLEFRGKLL